MSGIAFALVGLLLGACDVLALSGIVGTNAALDGVLGGLGAVAMLIATTFLGVAALRTRTLPRALAWTLIVVALVTIPILVATPLPFGPAWATDTIAFLLSGLAFDAVGATLLQLRTAQTAARHAVATTDASASSSRRAST
jgi:hypothetical protein